RRRHTRFSRDWSSDVCSSDLTRGGLAAFGTREQMGEGLYFIDILIFAMIAAFLVFRLRNVLGRRTGNEQQRPNPFSTGAQRPAEIGRASCRERVPILEVGVPV